MDKTFDEFQPKSEFYYDRGDRYEIKKKPTISFIRYQTKVVSKPEIKMLYTCMNY